MAKKKPFTPVANAAGVKSETIKAAADVVVNDAENVSNTVYSEKNDTTQEGIENNAENGVSTDTAESTEKTILHKKVAKTMPKMELVPILLKVL